MTEIVLPTGSTDPRYTPAPCGVCGSTETVETYTAYYCKKCGTKLWSSEDG